MKSTLSTHRFDGLRVTFEETPEDYGIFPSEQIALGFIAALAEESIKDCDDPLPAFSFTYLDFPRTAPHPLSIRMSFLGHDAAESRRINVNYALVAVPNALRSKNHIDGTKFWEDRRGFVTYSGAFGELLLPDDITATNNATAVRSTSRRRQLSNRSSLLSASSLFLPSNNEYQFSIDGTGDPISKNFVFISSLIYLLELSQANSEASVTEASFYAPSSPVWFYARGGPRNPSFQLKSIPGILKIIATRLVIEGRYRELAWSVRWRKDRVVMEGCMSKRRPRATIICQGIPGGPEFRPESRPDAGTSDSRRVDTSIGTA